MNSRRKILAWVLTASWMVAAATVGPAVTTAEASHARYANYNWKPTGVSNQIEFVLQNAFRMSGYGGGCYSTVPPHSNVPCTGPFGTPAVGDVIVEFVGGTMFNFGDATFVGSPLGPLFYVVTSIDPLNDWLLGNALDPNSFPAVDTTITHTYAASGDYVAFTDSCCRISTTAAPNEHLNNPDGFYRFETVVNVGTQGSNRSPVGSVPVIVLCPINTLCLFPITASDPDGDTLHFRLSTPTEASSLTSGNPNTHGTVCPVNFCQPGPPFSTNAASVNATTGVYSWNTTGAQLAVVQPNTLYSTQVMIEDLDGGGLIRSKVAVDFLIQLVPVVGSPPAFDVPPSPQCGTTLPAVVGQLLTFVIQASDPDSVDIVMLNVVGLPPGATMTPGLPTSGNPVSSTFNWTPSAPGTFALTFTATDQTGQQATCGYVIEIADAPPPNLEGRMTGGGRLVTAAGHVTHGFELHCTASETPNNLQVNWSGNRFHLESLTTAACTDDPAIGPAPPAAGFDTYKGKGTGRYNGQSGATAEWTFTDAGEPGRNDTFTINIWDSNSVLVLTATGTLDRGNHQAHK